MKNFKKIPKKVFKKSYIKFDYSNLLLKNESVSLPISFIVGICFISGSLVGSILNFKLKKD